MIRGNARRAYQPTEQPRQFAVSAIKGIDATKAPTDLTHATRMVNLVNNPDGSVSPRKPISEVRKFDADFMTHLHLFEYVVIVNGSALTIKDADSNSCDIRVKATDVSGKVHVSAVYSELNLGNVQYTPDTLQLTKLRTASVLSNFTLNVPEFISNLTFDKEFSAIDSALYDNADSRRARYLRLSYDSDADVWFAELTSPEVCELDSGEGTGLPLDPNLTLDNPYATRDRYASAAPTVRAVLPYAKVKKSGSDWELSEENLYTGERKFSKTYSATEVSDTTSSGLGLLKANSVVAVAHAQYAFGTSLLKVTGRVYVSYASRFSGTEPYDEDGAFGGEWSTAGAVRYCNDCTYSYKLTAELLGNMSSASTVTFGVAGEFGLKDPITTEYVGGTGQTETFDTTTIELTTSDTVGTVELFSAETTMALPLRVGQYIDNTENIAWSATELVSRITISNVQAKEEASSYTLVPGFRVKDVTESVKNPGFKIVSTAPYDATVRTYKAFCDFPKTFDDTNLYGEWSISFDGFTWNTVRQPCESYAYTHIFENGVKRPAYYYKLNVTDETDAVSVIAEDGLPIANRIDVLVLPELDNTFTSKPSVKFTLARLKQISDEHTDFDHTVFETQYISEMTYGTEFTQLLESPELEVADVSVGNAALGTKLMYKNSILSYGDPSFDNTILVSEPGSFITPYTNTIDTVISASGKVTKVAPWRDYLAVFTDNTSQLYSKADSGFVSKTISANIGIPDKFAESYAGTLNGFIFATEEKVYMAYPNVYSGTDDSMTISDISQPVEDVLSEYDGSEYRPFAFSTSSEYVLMLPRASDTLCLRYEFTEKRWTVCVYPVLFVRCDTTFYEDIRLYAVNTTGTATVSEFKFDVEALEPLYLKGYGDIFINGDVTPIHFEWDTGHKTDAIALTKQFVESKLVFTVEDEYEAFPMDLTIHVDGALHPTHVDVSTDAPFWKKGFEDKAVAGTGGLLNSAGSAKGTIKQLTVRYSGKGRSVRHILSGTTLSPFRLYEAYVRYKPLNVKQ